ncbi:nucleotidyltransferase family protein [Maricaulis sp.]|uniref:nucleotidyltransferase family protein n=1 Tax=Maricaulis sp. TaxID=1486257 RepID=UPI003A8C9A38
MIRIDTGMALAAGLGTRMRPLTNDRPKALVEVGGKALLDWALDRFQAAGVTRTIINVHHFADAMQAHIEAHPRATALTVSDERAEVLETGGGVVKALPLLGEDPVFISNIDAIWVDGAEAELDRMRAAWDGDRMDVLLLLAPMAATLGFDGAGDFFLGEDGRIAWRGEAARAPFAYAGVQIMKPSILAGRPAARFSMTEVWRDLVPKGRVYGLPMQSFWMHVGDPQAVKAAEARLAR